MRDGLRERTRRHFFRETGFGIGSLALLHLMDERLFAAPAQAASPFEPKPPHFAPKAKRVIFLFMAGAPSQVDLLDPKPKLKQHNGEPIPDELVKGERFAFIKGTPRLLGSPFRLRGRGPGGDRGVGALAALQDDRRPGGGRALAPNHAVQPRAGADLHEHRPPGGRPPLDGLVAQLRARQREP